MKKKRKEKLPLLAIVKILTILVLLFALPFYFGYGNPLPFIDSSYSLYDNLWLSIFPLMFIGLVLSFKKERLAGILLTIILGIGFLVSIFLGEGIPWPMLVPFSLGVINLILGSKNS